MAVDTRSVVDDFGSVSQPLPGWAAVASFDVEQLYPCIDQGKA